MRAVVVLALFAGLAFVAPVPARADMLTVCAADISQFCSDVGKGRGRISACLAAEIDRLGSGCKAEVMRVMRGPLTPKEVRGALNPGFKVALPQSCAASAKSLCPGVPTGDGRVLACLYARADRVPKPCVTAVRTALKNQ